MQTFDIENDYKGDFGINDSSNANALKDSTIYTFDVTKLGEYVRLFLFYISLVRYSQN